jgi:drug/metabolite transporter (DMT)-like permease
MLDNTTPAPSQITTAPEPAVAKTERIPFGAVDLALISMAFIWAMNFIVVKPLLPFFSPMAFVTLRFLIASSAFFILVRVRQGGFGVPRREFGLVFLIGIFSTTIYQPLFINGLARTDASSSSLILSSTPVFIVLLNRLFRGERLASRGWAGILLSFTGIGLIVFSGGALGLTSTMLLGDLFILGATLCWSLYSILTAPMLKTYSPLAVAALSTIFGTIPLALIGAPAVIGQDWGAITPPAWGALLYSALLAIVLAYTIWNHGLRRLGGARTALYSNLTPILATLAAAVFLNEALTPLKIVGAIVIFAGLYLARTANLVVEPEG